MKVRFLCGLVVLSLLLLLNRDNAYAHVVADGNPRVEYVYEPSAPPVSVWGVYGHIDLSNAGLVAINDGGWSWTEISVTDPSQGDCHNGAVNPTLLRALRMGWMRNVNWLFSEEMHLAVAYITYDNDIILDEYGPYPKNFINQYELAITRDPDTINKPNVWRFHLRRQPTPGSGWGPWFTVGETRIGGTFPVGPAVDMKCVTAGGWASSYANDVGAEDDNGEAVISDLHYLDRDLSASWLLLPIILPQYGGHTVENDPPYEFTVDSIGQSLIVETDR